MDGKVAIITGASDGIGRVTAIELAKQGARIIIACKDKEKGKIVKDEITKETKNAQIVVRKLDMSSQKSIREFAFDILNTEPLLHVLIHSDATSVGIRPKHSVDNIELTLATNHYGPFLLTTLLIDLLRRSAPSRIIVVSHCFYRLGILNLNKMNPLGAYPGFYNEYVSKRLNIMFTLELARRLEGTGVTANVLHPGIVDSEHWKYIPWPYHYVVKFVCRCVFKSVENGAKTPVYLAMSKEVEGVSGKYFVECREAALNEAVKNSEMLMKVWEISCKLTKLTVEDPKI